MKLRERLRRFWNYGPCWLPDSRFKHSWKFVLIEHHEDPEATRECMFCSYVESAVEEVEAIGDKGSPYRD